MNLFKIAGTFIATVFILIIVGWLLIGVVFVTGILKLTFGICFILGLFVGWAWWIELLLFLAAISVTIEINGEVS